MLKATNGTDTIYYTRGFELISRHEGDASSYYLYDGGFSVRALTDTTGAITDTLVFDAFGNETEKTGTTANTYGFQGEEKDATGLYYLRARYMDPVTGTFTSMDTYSGSLSDPMSLHKYLFANSNPVMYSDPSGHSSVSMVECLAVCNLITIMCSVVSYTVEAFIQPNGFETHDASWGLFKRLVQTIIICIIVDIIILLLFVAIDFIAGIIEFVPVGRIISQLQKAADKWGVSSGKDGDPAVNQGIKHYYIYYDENAKRVIDLLTRLGLDPDDFGFNIQSFVKFTDEVENAKNEAIYLGQYYSNGVKTIYYVESASDNRIVVIIEQFGKLQSVMNSDWKSLENMVRKMFGG